MDISCEFGELRKVGLKEWIQCKKLNGVCLFQRYCTTKKQVVHTKEALTCKARNDNER